MLLRKIVEEIVLYEGLDITHSMDASLTNLLRLWNFNSHVTYEEFNNTIKMVVNKPIERRDFDSVLRNIENLLGYFPAHIVTKKSNFKFEYNTVIKLLENGTYFGIYFDAKYDQEIVEKKLPSLMYHITPSVNERRILKIGLYPKRKDKMSKHPDRIYLTYSPETAIGLLTNKNFLSDKDEFTLFSINFKEFKKVRKIRFFEDPIYAGKGCYTYENIPPKYLDVVNRIKV